MARALAEGVFCSILGLERCGFKKIQLGLGLGAGLGCVLVELGLGRGS